MANKGDKTAAEAQIRKAFNEMDSDGSGYLEPHELKQALAAIGCLTEEEVASIAKSMVEEDDEDNDGKISFEEFKKGVERENEKLKKA